MRLLCPTPSDAFGTARQSGIDIDTTLVLPSDAVRFVTWLDSSGLWSYQAMLRFVTCTDGSFDVIRSTMVVAVSEGAVVQGLRLK